MVQMFHCSVAPARESVAHQERLTRPAEVSSAGAAHPATKLLQWSEYHTPACCCTMPTTACSGWITYWSTTSAGHGVLAAHSLSSVCPNLLIVCGLCHAPVWLTSHCSVQPPAAPCSAWVLALHLHRSSTGTSAKAESMWRPQPLHVGLPHLLQVVL